MPVRLILIGVSFLALIVAEVLMRKEINEKPTGTAAPVSPPAAPVAAPAKSDDKAA